MRVTNIMFDLVEGTASLGLFGEMGMEAGLRPPHVQVTVPVAADGDRAALRRASVREALAALDAARAVLAAELA